MLLCLFRSAPTRLPEAPARAASLVALPDEETEDVKSRLELPLPPLLFRLLPSLLLLLLLLLLLMSPPLSPLLVLLQLLLLVLLLLLLLLLLLRRHLLLRWLMLPKLLPRVCPLFMRKLLASVRLP